MVLFFSASSLVVFGIIIAGQLGRVPMDGSLEVWQDSLWEAGWAGGGGLGETDF